MTIRDLHLFEGGARLQMNESIELTMQSLQAYGPAHEHWVVAWSGGKDSTATLTLIVWLINTGKIRAPKRLTVLYADTRQELPPLAIAAEAIMDELAERDIECRIVRAPLDKRFLVYILGRGVPPPNNNTLRWCTRQIKVDPMAAAIAESIGDGTALTITGVRQGESAIRDRRIEMSCGKDGAECGQGWYQQVLPESRSVRGRIATLAPLLHWRVCHVWEWLRHWAPREEFGGWSSELIADAYGGDEAEETNARTGCIACPLAQEEKALNSILAMPRWRHLAPLHELKPIYRWLREPAQRLRKSGIERLKDGSIGKNPQRMGPLTFEARLSALDQILDIQHRVNLGAIGNGWKGDVFELINAEEEARIRALIATETWPDGWNGDEPHADEWLPVTIYGNGAEQHDLFGLEEAS
ncbi:phosphoadenosine phosphosulfate reductase family protein [Methyloversatilis sp.]|uniref:phosphoadenosine phosphosulfate reductase domain-containing protein n=1 Tax=Methyloversatilis sp. TaxID=2569862 RepID=UPI0027346AE1|nr:phosphoadenosine phosphosulfate reductase family protein [Methyloversatilis sp.]MDP3579106.1 phosphoadenosine phosphosulfate reductase family protein [Methyloversatilis sp.]